MDGLGVPNTDLVVYISVDNCSDRNENTLAYASSCQLESNQDRPIAGFINFCSGSFNTQSNDELIRLGIHEIIHVLVSLIFAFSSAIIKLTSYHNYILAIKINAD